MQPEPNQFTNARTSPLAITSFILGILGIPTFGITSLPAVICGHPGLSGIKKSQGTIG